MELGPAFGREASAALMLVKSPGVPPGQPTVVSVANARLDNRSINKQADKNLGLKQRSFMRFLALMDLKFVRPGQNYKTANMCCQGNSAESGKNVSGA
jgi:hypothetical protein